VAVDVNPAEDVKAEAERVEAITDYQQHPIVVRDMRKVYPGADGQPPKVRGWGVGSAGRGGGDRGAGAGDRGADCQPPRKCGGVVGHSGRGGVSRAVPALQLAVSWLA
jgi:hypothetical protein